MKFCTVNSTDYLFHFLGNCPHSFTVLLHDYYNRGHLDKVDQSDYRKITIHSKKVGCGPISSS